MLCACLALSRDVGGEVRAVYADRESIERHTVVGVETRRGLVAEVVVPIEEVTPRLWVLRIE